MLNILTKNKTKCFWDSLSSTEQHECIRKDRPVTIGGQTVWVTQGKVQNTWQDLVYPSIEKILKTQEARIFEPNNGLIIAFDVNVYMRGTLQKFRPTVVVSCMVAKVAILILKLVKGHLKPHRLGFEYLATNGAISPKTGDPSDTGPLSSSLNACGVPILVRFDGGGSHKIKAATIGGCLQIGSKPYGLTAAHILFPDLANYTEVPTGIEDTSVECWEVCSDMSDFDVSEHSHGTSLKSSASLGLEENRQEYFWRSDSREFQLSDYDPLLWDLVMQARELENHELDWLLIPLEADDLHFENRVHFGERDIYLRGVANDVPDDNVILVAGQSGNQLLKASSTLGGIFIPSARKLLRTWSIFHEDRALTRGDSGSWAINEFGEVYGFLVGTNEGSGVSHVAPMVTTIAAIREQNPDAEISFPIRRPEQHPEQRQLSVHKTERQLQSTVPLHATYIDHPLIGRGSQAASVKPWLDEVQAQSAEPPSTDQLYDRVDTENDRPDIDDVVSDVASVGSFDVPFGSDAGDYRSSATSSMIFSVGIQSGDAKDDLEFASQDKDFEASLANLQGLFSSIPIIRGTSGDREKIDPKYYKRPDAEKFFVVGRVFAYLSHETVEEGKYLGNVSYITGSKDGRQTLSRIRRLTVIQECDGYCIAVPIETYSNQGLLKGDLDETSKAHAFVYGSDTMPSTMEKGEGMMAKEAIAINLSGAEKKLESVIRLEFGKATVVQWEVKVMDIGKVATKSKSAFTRYALNTMEQLQLRISVPRGAATAIEASSRGAPPPEEPALLRGLGETYIYDYEQGEMERMARGYSPFHSFNR